MDVDQFWSTIEQSKAESSDEQNEKLRRLLDRLRVEEIVAFDRIFDELLQTAYTWNLWGAAYVLNGGCSDDGFEYFRRGLIASGREKFENALKDPDSLADWAEPDELENEGIGYVACKVYQAKTGTKEYLQHDIIRHREPTGEPWNEDGDDLERRFPKLWEKTGG